MTGGEDDDAPESAYDDLLREIARASERAPTPARAALVAGKVVAGKFRIVRLLGAGGMGEVFEVEHLLTRHRRALKVLHAGASADGVERFMREASAAAQIASPHVTETFDAGRLEGGEPYLLMEYLEGETLDERLRRVGRLDPGELSALVHQACQGVQAAHDAGIVHRDLKPDNLFIEQRANGPFIKILDFGISKFKESRAGAPGITRDGSVMGTPFYMAPEQVRGAAIDARTDVYALGVILYECASGHRPFEAARQERLAVLIHRGQPVPLGERVPSLPVAFCEVVRRAMATEPGQRFESARAMADALAPLRTHVIRAVAPAQGGQPRSPRPSRRSPALLGIAAAGIVAGSASAWLTARPTVVPRAVPVEATSAPVSFSATPLPTAILESPPLALPVAPLAPTPSPLPSAPRAPLLPRVPRSRADQKGLAGENPFR